MSKARRLRAPHEFQRVVRGGKRVASSLFVCIAVTNEGDSIGVGVSAGRAIGGAVKRNRAKRLLREAARAALAEIRPGTDLVLVAKPAIVGKSFQSVQQEVRAAVTRLRIAC